MVNLLVNLLVEEIFWRLVRICQIYDTLLTGTCWQQFTVDDTEVVDIF